MAGTDADVDRIANRLLGVIQNGGDRLVANRVVKLEEALVALQGQFFTILAAMAINVDGPPELGAYTPVWKELSPKYLKKKRKQGKGYYSFTGQLRLSLLRSKALTAFGTPLVSVTSVGNAGKKRAYVIEQNGRQLGRLGTGGVVALGNIKNLLPKAIVIDLYPDVKESLHGGSINEGKYFSKKIAIKMTNFRGGRDRPILLNYMNWWLDVQAGNLVKKVLRT